MARRKLIGDLIDEFKEKKIALDSAKKECDSLNKDIKGYLISNNLDEVSSDKWTAKLSRTQRGESLDDEKAIEILKENLDEDDLKKCVKTIEVLDEDAVASLSYEGKFDLAKLDCCKVAGKEVVTLRISKKK